MSSLKQYFEENKVDDFEIKEIFLSLDKSLKSLHRKGGYLYKVNSDHVLVDERNVLLDSRYLIFSDEEEEQERHQNIQDFAKLMLGAYFTNEVGFYDFTQLSNDYLKENLEDFLESSPESDCFYLEEVLKNNNYIYYNDYLKSDKFIISEGRSKEGLRKVKATPIGKAMSDKNDYQISAYINILLYPALATLIGTVCYLIYSLK